MARVVRAKSMAAHDTPRERRASSRTVGLPRAIGRGPPRQSCVMRCVGHVWVNTRPDDRSVGSVGYWLLPTARGRGLATRAVRLVSRWAFDELGITVLRLYAEPANEPSLRVAERCGFRRIGIVSRDGQIHDRPVDYIQFELTLEQCQDIADRPT